MSMWKNFGLLFWFLFFNSIAIAANYPLKIVRPNSNIGIWDRIYKAYPGLTYKTRVVVYGGTYPFRYSLKNAPNGMSIDSTGLILWENPNANAKDIVVKVIDAEGTEVEAVWSIDITKDGFYFVDASAPDGGNGTIEHPWNSWDDFYLGYSDNTYEHAIIYFKNGVYTYPYQYVRGTAGSSNRLWLSGHPMVFLNYPGENEVYFDGELSTHRVHLYVNRDNLYCEGIHFINGYGFNIEIGGGNYHYISDCSFYHLEGSGSSSNQAAISFRVDAPINDNIPPASDDGYKLYPVVVHCVFNNFVRNEDGIGCYGLRYAVFADNVFYDINAECIRIKSTTDKIIVRHNRFLSSKLESGYGLYIMGQYYSDNNDISFNLFNFIDNAIGFGAYKSGENMGPGLTYFYRNTIIGNFYFRNIDEDSDGPAIIYNNIIINNSPLDHIRDEPGEHYSIEYDVSVLGDNLYGILSDNIVDSNGNLTPAYLQYLGTYGWQVLLDEDVNQDGQVNISDVQLIVNIILGNATNRRADVNGDGNANVSDLQVVVNRIVG